MKISYCVEEKFLNWRSRMMAGYFANFCRAFPKWSNNERLLKKPEDFSSTLGKRVRYSMSLAKIRQPTLLQKIEHSNWSQKILPFLCVDLKLFRQRTTDLVSQKSRYFTMKENGFNIFGAPFLKHLGIISILLSWAKSQMGPCPAAFLSRFRDDLNHMVK